MTVTISGTKHGMTPIQKQQFLDYFINNSNRFETIYMGDFIGVEEEIFGIVSDIDTLKDKFELFRIENRRVLALCQARVCHKAKDYFEFRKIVLPKTDKFIFIPHTTQENNINLWSLFNMAVKNKKDFVMFYPDGTYVHQTFWTRKT